MTSGIYQIKNLVNGKRYIGSSKNIVRRFGEHKSRLKNNNHYNQHLQRAYNKYGKDSFQFKIITRCIPHHLVRYEEYFIQKFNSYEKGYNQTLYADRRIYTNKQIKEYSKKAKEGNWANRFLSHSGKDHHMYGKTHSEESKQKMSQSLQGRRGPWRGKSRSKETKRNISENRARLKIYRVMKIFWLAYKGDLTQREIGNKFGVDSSHVSDIKNQKKWKYHKFSDLK